MTRSRIVNVAAPSWARRALDLAERELARSVTIRHVAVGETAVPENLAPDANLLWRYHLPADRAPEVPSTNSSPGLESTRAPSASRTFPSPNCAAAAFACRTAPAYRRGRWPSGSSLPSSQRPNNSRDSSDSPAPALGAGPPRASAPERWSFILGPGAVGPATAALWPFDLDVRAASAGPGSPATRRRRS